MASELELGPRELEPRGNLSRARADVVLAPRTTTETVEAFELARARRAQIPGSSLTLVGACRSFEGHFLPPENSTTSAVLSSERLKGVLQMHAGADPSSLKVRAYAGTNFAELLAEVNSKTDGYAPFTCPTADAISLGGALIANTHGRTSDTYGGFFADHVPWFRLVTPSGAVYDCSRDAPNEVARALYRYAPGSFGALGMVTELEIELRAMPRESSIVSEVLSAHARQPARAVEAYAAAVAENRARVPTPWPEGVGLVLLGPPKTGNAVVMARRTETFAAEGPPRRKRPTLPLLGDSQQSNAALQLISHRFPRLGHWVATRTLRSGRSFSSSYYRWAFFQSSYDEVARGFGHAAAPWNWFFRALGADPRLTLIHAAWVIPVSELTAFMQLYLSEIDRPELGEVARRLEFQDLLPVPQSSFPLSPSFDHSGGSHVLTLSFSLCAESDGIRAKIQGFCQALTRASAEAGLRARVQLIKQLHVSNEVLRSMYERPLEELRRLKALVDPDDVLGSRTLERLGVGGLARARPPELERARPPNESLET